ncbi:MAG: CRTAC1 family protein, partial [Candidatus Aminicenantes bacterium]|nr:CRTAC1 family protein [Candidatus Aminicenantes bacterium]
MIAIAVVLLWGQLSAQRPPGDRVVFSDVTRAAGIDFLHESGLSKEKLIVETVGSGLAWIDYDNDGHLDLYLVNGSRMSEEKPSPGNALFRNRGRGTFDNVTRKAGVAGNGSYGMGVAVGDYDNDGWLDLYVTNYGLNQLFRNTGDGTFSDVASKAGVDSRRWGSSAGFFDFDRDGDLDLYVVNYLEYDPEDNPYCGLPKEGYRLYCDIRMFEGVADQLYRNNGDGSFTDVSNSAGIANPAGKGLGLTFADFDGDGYPDIYVANDTIRDFLYRNNGDGTFSDVTYAAAVGFDANGEPQAGMGVDAADWDNDGRPDILVTNFAYELNALYRNGPNLLFQEVSERMGLGSGLLPLGFGAKLFDYDNDGDVDIYVANGHIENNVHFYFANLTYAQTDLLFENQGTGFLDVSAKSGAPFGIPAVGRGAAVADYDNDGDLDIALSNSGGHAVLMRNEGGNRNNWIAIQARGRESNSFGLGTGVRIETEQGTQVGQVNNVASYLSSNDLRIYFGLGRTDPGGDRQHA